MNKLLNCARNVLLAAAVTGVALGGSTALAEDIEVYVGQGGDLGGVPPNILFVIDTSGSMNGQVENSAPPYDPNTVYAGDCTDDRYYWDDDSNYPDCDTDQFIYATAFYCDAALTAFESSGYFQDRYGSWRDSSGTSNDSWRDVDDDFPSRKTDCKTDSGVHGDGVDTSKLYAANQSRGPWNSNSSYSINWNDRDVVTFMSANFLNYYNGPGTETSTRLEVVQDVTKTLLDSVANVNFGLMRFDTGAAGGMVLFPVADVTTNKTAMKASIDTLTPGGGTPLSETYYEAIQYYRGSDVDFGLDSHVNTDTVPSVAESRGNGDSDLDDAEDADYLSPIEFQCQKNFIVFLTDGEPTSDSHAGSKIKAWPSFSSLNDSCSDSISGDCLDEAALYARNRDLRTDMNGDQNVITYMIGFAEEVSVLETTASKGGGSFYLANDSLELLNVFTTIISEILAINTTFTAPAVSVNAFNRTVHLNQLYFTIFKPSELPHWDGNVKRFDLGFSGGVLDILDANGDLAVDPETGFFADDATSVWTAVADAPDGGEAALGGAASKLTNTRDVYTYLGTDTDLEDATNAVAGSNTGITKAMLGDAAMSDATRTSILAWLTGIDVNDDDDDGSATDARRILGDPLHSKPVVVTYGGTAAEPDLTIFFTTNDGFLHAIDADDGTEQFAFIPTETMVNANDLFENLGTFGSKIYGLDASVIPHINDADKDGIIEAADGDFVHLIFGMRRGGRNYYALDVTDRSAPNFLWKITGGAGDFVELGQTWSDPVLGKVKIGSTTKDVLIFGGGYDTNQDEDTLYDVDTVGRAIYMVNASTGAREWWAGPTSSGANLVISDLKNGIPSNVRAVDMNSDGLLDRMYVGDMGGRLFRFDIINGQAVATLVTGGKIASLGAGDMATPDLENSRRFYYAPDLAVIVDDYLGTYLHVGLGSGYREHPLNAQVRDRFYALRDTNVFTVPASYSAAPYGIDHEDIADGDADDDLYDATDNVIGEGNATQKTAALNTLGSSKGWFIDLIKFSDDSLEGEKVLAEARTIDNQVVFTSFTPVEDTGAVSCAPSQGLAKLYVVSATTAVPVRDYNESGGTDLTREDRAHTLTRGGIPPELTVLYPEIASDQPVGLVGPERVNVGLTNEPIRTYWIQEDADDGGG